MSFYFTAFPSVIPNDFKVEKHEEEDIKQLLFDSLDKKDLYHITKWLRQGKEIKIYDEGEFWGYANIDSIEIGVIRSFGGKSKD